MLFKKEFTVVKIYESGASATWILKGKPQEVNRDIEQIKRESKRYEMIGKDGMVVWA